MDAEIIERPVLRRPLVGLAAGFVAGVWCGLAWPAPPAPHLVLFGVGLGAYAVCDQAARRFVRRGDGAATRAVRWGQAASASLLASALLAGWVWAVLRVHEPRGLLLRNLMQKPQEAVELEGMVADDPAVRPAAGGRAATWRFSLETERVRRAGDWQPARGRVAVMLKAGTEDGPPPRYGESWRLFGVLTDASRHPPPERGIVRPIPAWVGTPYMFRGQAADTDRLAEGRGHPILAATYALRRHGSRLLMLGLEDKPEVAGLLQALLLGYRQELSQGLREVFMATGTFHVFAISGQHVMLVSVFLIFLLQARGLSRVRWFWGLAPVLILYTLVTGMSPSALRGCIMALAFYAAPLCLRKPDPPSSLALAAILILALDPAQLVNRGFILSFTAVAGLTVVYPELVRRAAGLVRSDPFRIDPEAKPVRWLRRAGLAMVQLLAASLAAWLATAPLGARWFHIVSIIGIVANLLVVPAIGLVLALGFAAMLAGSLVPALAAVCNWVNLGVVTLMVEAVSGMAKVPGGYAFVRAPPWWFVVGWYGSILAWLLRRGRSRRWLLAPLALAVLTAGAWWWDRDHVVIETLHPGQRPVVWVRAPGGNSLLVDTGPRFQAYALSRLLRERGVDRLDWVLFTRLIASQAGAAAEGLAAVRVGGLAVPRGGLRRSPTGQALDALAQSRQVPILEVDGAGGSIGNVDLAWNAIYPLADLDVRGGEAVLVLRLVCRDSVILIRGDAHPAVEEALLREPDRLKADVLILLDSAAADACSRAFLDGVSPRRVVAAGLPPVRLAARPDMPVEGLAPGEGIRLSRRTSDWRVERSRLDP